MLNLFKSQPRYKGGTLRSPELPYMRRVLNEEIKRVIAYYRTHYKRIDNEHLLVQLIKSLPLSNSLPDYDYAAYIKDTMGGIIRRMGICAPVNKGTVHSGGILLGPSTNEILVTFSDDETYFKTETHWESLTPVKYLYHTRSDVNLPIMNNTTKGKGFGILGIDVPLLMVKYRYWVNECARTLEQSPTVAYFIGTYVLPDIVPSYLDLAVFNRIDLQYSGLPLRNYPTPHPFFVQDYTTKIDQLAKDTIRLNASRGLDMDGLLWDTPLIVKDNALSLVQAPNPLASRNTEWAYLLQILPFIRYVCKHPGVSKSGDQMTNLKINLQGIVNGKAFATVIANKEVKNEFERIAREALELQ